MVIQNKDTYPHKLPQCTRVHTRTAVNLIRTFAFSLSGLKQPSCNHDLRYGLCCEQVCLRTAWRSQKQRNLLWWAKVTSLSHQEELLLFPETMMSYWNWIGESWPYALAASQGEGESLAERSQRVWEEIKWIQTGCLNFHCLLSLC